MQSGKSTIWKSCLPAAFYSSLIFGLTQDTGRTKGQAWEVRGFCIRTSLGSSVGLNWIKMKQQPQQNWEAFAQSLGWPLLPLDFWVIFPTLTLSLTPGTSWRPCPGWALPLSHRGHWAQMSSSDSRPRLKTAPRPQCSFLWLPVTCQVTWEVLHVF